MARYIAAINVLLLTLVCGCFYELRDEMAECKISCANHFAAHAAWRTVRRNCGGFCCPHSFKTGFMNGYTDVADGGNGCPPVTPQIDLFNCMWLDRCSESEKMAAWYSGYEAGAAAAQEDGVAEFNCITIRIPQPMPVGSQASEGNRIDQSPEGSPQGEPASPVPSTDEDMKEQTIQLLPREVVE
jgi:hypothetical protein